MATFKSGVNGYAQWQATTLTGIKTWRYTETQTQVPVQNSSTGEWSDSLDGHKSANIVLTFDTDYDTNKHIAASMRAGDRGTFNLYEDAVKYHIVPAKILSIDFGAEPGQDITNAGTINARSTGAPTLNQQ